MATVLDFHEMSTSQERDSAVHENGENTKEKLASTPSAIVIDMESHSTPSSIQSMKKEKSKLSLNDAEAKSEREAKEKRMKMEIAMMATSQRLTTRKVLHHQLTRISDIMTVLALLGLILMIIANELTFNQQDNTDTLASWVIKLVISISTAALLVFVMHYHLTDLKLYCAQNALHDWRVGLTLKKVLFILLELAVCAVHPMPRAYPRRDDLSVTEEKPSLGYTAVDVGLGCPMFLRLYIVGRTMLYHSKLVRDASLQSLGYLNRVSINFFFLMKTFLEVQPIRSLCLFQTLAFFIGSWCIRACNYSSDGKHFSIGDSMWLYIVTFTTVGYGDLYPSSTCGRVFSALVGIVGILSSALLIAVIAQKLVLRREEKYVHTFVMNIELAKARKIHAANVVKYTILVWYLKNKKGPKSLKYIRFQRRLFLEIFSLQQVKAAQRGLIDNCVGLHELMTVQRATGEQTEGNSEQIRSLQNHVAEIGQQMIQLHQVVQTVQSSLTILIEKTPSQ